MLDQAKRILEATRKKHDQAFNVHVMRPLAAVVVAWLAPTSITPNQVTLVSLAVFVIAAGELVIVSGFWGGILGVVLIESSYLFDCADGMLARYKRQASKEGHLFDFFTDEIKALLLTAGLSIRLARAGSEASARATRLTGSDIPRGRRARCCRGGVGDLPHQLHSTARAFWAVRRPSRLTTRLTPPCGAAVQSPG